MDKKTFTLKGHREPGKKKSTWGWIFLALPLIGMAVGIYLLVTITAPMIPTSPDVVIKKLKQTLPSSENRLYIPKIGVDVPFVTGDASSLEKGAWHRFPERGDPETGGNFILSAHRFRFRPTPEETRNSSPFYYINKLEPGDRIYVDYNKKRYTYELAEKFQIKPSQTEIEEPSNQAKMTLYSCTLLGSHDGREVFIAKPIREN